jgi:hypothetical protein
MTTSVTIFPAAATKVIAGGVPVTAVFGGISGGRITNPATPTDQGIGTVETLFYNYTAPASTLQTGTNIPLQPGQWVDLPPGLASNVSVNAATTGHRFSAYIIQPRIQPTPTPVPGTFPPAAQASLQTTIKSYLYQQYIDDDNLQAWVNAYNAYTQLYLNWFNQNPLAIYTNPNINGALLDWVANNLYGIARPTLSSGRNQDIGPYNTGLFNQVGWNIDQRIGPSNVTITSDDIFKRILTWNLYRGDGKVFNLNWLKRRITRFLNGPNGTDPGVQQTYSVSAFYPSRFQVDVILPANPNSTILKECMDSRSVALPFQLSFSTTVS